MPVTRNFFPEKTSLGWACQGRGEGPDLLGVNLLIHEPGRLQNQVADLGGDGVEVIRHRVQEGHHGGTVVLIDGEGLFQGHGLAVRSLDFGQGLGKIVKLIQQLAVGSLNGPVLGNGHPDDGDLGYGHLEVLTDALQGVALGGDEGRLQEVVSPGHAQFQIGPHDGAGETLDVLVGLLEGRDTSPHPHRQEPGGVDQFLRDKQGKQPTAGFPVSFKLVWMVA